MRVLLFFGLFVVIATAHNITYMEVPRYGDPRTPTALVCQYVFDKEDPPLHSVKWYRGVTEIFRYTPADQPPNLTFNSTASLKVTGSCNHRTCTIHLKLPQSYNTRLSFTCEVSTEGPRFAVVKETMNLTIAATLKEDPVISGVPGNVQFGEDVTINCTAGPAMPPANIVWFIDGKPERIDPWVVNHTQVSSVNEKGLRSSWRGLRIRVATPVGFLELRCEATQPTWPPYVRAANATITIARSPHLSMFTAKGFSIMMEENGLITAICLMVHILSKYSALSDSM